MKEWCRGIAAPLKANPFFACLCLLECVFLLTLCFRLFREPIVLDIPPESFLIWNQQNAQLGEGGQELRILDPAQVGKEAEYISEFYPLSAGAYLLTVEYQSVTDLKNPSRSFEDNAAFLNVRSSANPSAVVGDRVVLIDGQTSVTTRVYVSLMGRLKDFQLVATYTGTGSLTLKGVTIQEQVVWRWVRLAGLLLLFGVVDLLYWLLFAKGQERLELGVRRYRHGLCLGAVALLASLPLFANFAFSGHDLEFHLARIGALAAELRNGQLPVRMLTTMLNGYGYPTPLYYCDLLLYLPALLYNAMLPLRATYQIYVFLVNAATCAIAWLSFSKVARDRTVGVVCTALYVLAPQRLMTIYQRAAVGEYSATIFLPLIVWGLWNVYSQADRRRIAFREYLPLALGVSGILQCHVLSLEMTALFLVGIGLGLPRKTFQLQRLLALGKAAALSLALGLWFLGPMVESMASMSIWGDQPHVIAKLQHIALYPMQLLDLFHPVFENNFYSRLRGDMALTLGLPLVLCLAPALDALLHRHRWKLEGDSHFRLLKTSLVAAAAAAFMTTSLFPWDSLENWLGKTVAHYFGIIQFPWRYLTPAIIAMTAMALASLVLLKTHRPQLFRRAAALVAGVAVLSASFYYSQSMFSLGKMTLVDYGSLPRQINGIWYTVGSREYMLSDADMMAIARPEVESAAPGLTVTSYQNQGRGVALACENSGPAAQATLPIFAYDHYEAYDQATGEKLTTMGADGNGRLAVTVPAGYQGTIHIQYAPPLRWRVFEGVSLAALLLVCFGLYRGRRRGALE